LLYFGLSVTDTSKKLMMRSKMMSKTQIKARAKQIPFNVSLPWGDSIAAYLGVSLDELKVN